MLLLLPPSEGKTAARSGRRLDLDRLSHPSLTARRTAVLDALVEVSGRADASAVLGVGPGAAGDVAGNLTVRTAPTAEARHIYTGVLYAAAGLGDLSGTALRRAQRSVRTVSALWGLVAPRDHVPAYRLSMGTDLPGVGPLATTWRGPLAMELDARVEGVLVVDCRSAVYRTAWAPPAGAHHVTVRVVHEVDGVRRVVSHDAKRTRGVLTGHLLRRPGALPTSVLGLADVASELAGVAVEVHRDRTHDVLTLVTRA